MRAAVATSGLEMSQNSMRLPWSADEVDRRLHEIMKRIHDTCVTTAQRFGQPGNYVVGQISLVPKSCRCNA